MHLKTPQSTCTCGDLQDHQAFKCKKCVSISDFLGCFLKSEEGKGDILHKELGQ